MQNINEEIEITLSALKVNNFDAKFAENVQIASNIVLDITPRDATVGVGDSATIRQIGVLDKLESRGTKMLNAFTKELTTDKIKYATRGEIQRKIFTSDVFLTGTNAVTLDGKLVNIDGVGSRVAAMIFGPRKVIVVVSKNKIVKDVEEALYRIKNVIAPYHAKTKRIQTPCTLTGRCINCNATNRMCNITTIIEKKPWRTNIVVILVDADLGLSWDESWDHERISNIKSEYEKVTWVFTGSPLY